MPKLIHQKWNRRGRTFHNGHQKVYKSSMGQENIETSPNVFAPYVWDASKKIAYYADMEARFIVNGQNIDIEIWRKKDKRVKFSFHPEVKSVSWERQTTYVSDIRVTEIQTTEAKDKLEIAYDLTTSDQKSTIKVNVGCDYLLNVGMDVKNTSSRTKELRLVMDTDIDDADSLFFCKKNLINGKMVQGDKCGYVSQKAKMKLRWAKDEVDDHKLIPSSDFKISLREGSYKTNEIKSLSPTTWGATDIDDNDNDGDGRGAPHNDFFKDGIFGTGSIYVDPASGILYVGLRWDSIDLGGTPDSIDSGTEIAYEMDDYANSGAFDVKFQAVESNSPAAFTTTPPGAVGDYTETTIARDVSGESTGAKTQTVETIVEELVETNGYSYSGGTADAMNFVIENTTGGNNDWYGIEDLSAAGGKEASLTIVYTAAAVAGKRRIMFY